MPGVFQRKGRNGKRSKTWTAWWVDEDGRKVEKAAGRDKAAAESIAKTNDARARLVKAGIIDRAEAAQQVAAGRPIGDHVEDYRLSLLALDRKPKHAGDTAARLVGLLEDAGIRTVSEITQDRVQGALGRLRQRRSPRTTNAALIALKAFARWLHGANRLRDYPAWLRSLKPFSQEVDRKRVRRALTPDEFRRLIAATEAAPELEVLRGPRDRLRVAGSRRFLSGPERAALYRLAAGTGFRANELRSLTRESFDLSDRPAVTVQAGYSKRKRQDRQPIRADLAELLRPFVEAAEPGAAVFPVPEKCAKMLRADLERAGIPYEAGGKVADFHAMRGHYITGLWLTCDNPVEVQRLARHSDIKLTTNTYTTVEEDRLRKALGEG